MTRRPDYERRRDAVAFVAAMVAAVTIGWALGSWDHARLVDQCRTDPSGIYCTEEKRP